MKIAIVAAGLDSNIVVASLRVPLLSGGMTSNELSWAKR
jgi:hypothetical protein